MRSASITIRAFPEGVDNRYECFTTQIGLLYPSCVKLG
jgi:hypothetical protein